MSLRTSHALLRTVVPAFGALPIYGQPADTGRIAGNVSDPGGALVPHAAVVINSQCTGEKRDLATDARGNFPAQFLPPGNYDLVVSAAGFEPFVLKGVQVQISEVSTVEIHLHPVVKRSKSPLAQHLLSFKLRTQLSDESSIGTRLKNCRWSIATSPRCPA
jgi:hypothetical protein